MPLPQALDTARIILSHLVRLDFHGLRRLVRVNTLFDEDKIVWNFSNLDKLFTTLTLPMPGQTVSPLPEAKQDIPETFDVNGGQVRLTDHIKERNLKSLLILHKGALISEQYFQGTKAHDPHISWSMSKSVLSVLLGVLIDRGDIPEEALQYQLSDHLPSLKGSGYDGVTLQNALNMSSGVAFNEDYIDYHSDINRLGRVIGVGGSIDAFAATLGREWEPGTYSHYVSVDTHVIGMMIRALTGREMLDLLSEHVIDPMGFERPGFFLADDFKEAFVLGGLNISSRDYARIGLMALNEGHWNDRQIVSKEWMRRSTVQSAPPPDPKRAAEPDGALGYGFQWWLPPAAMDGEFSALGIYGQYVYVNRHYDTVIVQNAADTKFRTGEGQININTLALFRAIAKAVAEGAA